MIIVTISDMSGDGNCQLRLGSSGCDIPPLRTPDTDWLVTLGPTGGGAHTAHWDTTEVLSQVSPLRVNKLIKYLRTNEFKRGLKAFTASLNMQFLQNPDAWMSWTNVRPEPGHMWSVPAPGTWPTGVLLQGSLKENKRLQHTQIENLFPLFASNYMESKHLFIQVNFVHFSATPTFDQKTYWQV